MNHDQYNGVRDADFVLCRREGPYSDGRRPDWVSIGNLYDDLARRDFTVNAIAMDADGSYIDPHFGRADLDLRTLRFVGEPWDRIREDALRIMRAIRFAVTKDMGWDSLMTMIIIDGRDHEIEEISELLRNISKERRADELSKMFKHNTLETLRWFERLPPPILNAIFSGGVRLDSTLKS